MNQGSRNCYGWGGDISIVYSPLCVAGFVSVWTSRLNHSSKLYQFFLYVTFKCRVDKVDKNWIMLYVFLLVAHIDSRKWASPITFVKASSNRRPCTLRIGEPMRRVHWQLALIHNPHCPKNFWSGNTRAGEFVK